MTDRQILNRNLAQMLKGGVIMDVTNAQEAEIAEAAGAVAVMALERVPSDIRRDGGVARMSDPKLIKEIKSAVSIPVMAKVRIGHIVEAEILEALGIDYIDESEVLTPADDLYHLDKHAFKIPFVCGCKNKKKRSLHSRLRFLCAECLNLMFDMIQRLGKQRQDVFVVQRVNDFFAGLGKLDQLSMAQLPQLMRNSGMSHIQHFGDITDAHVLVGQQF